MVQKKANVSGDFRVKELGSCGTTFLYFDPIIWRWYVNVSSYIIIIIVRVWAYHQRERGDTHGRPTFICMFNMSTVTLKNMDCWSKTLGYYTIVPYILYGDNVIRVWS